MTFFEYRNQLFEDVKNSSDNPRERQLYLTGVCAEILKKYLNFDEISTVPENDPSCPFDLFGIHDRTLYLIKLDESCLSRGEETLSRNEIIPVSQSLINFVRRAAAITGVSATGCTKTLVAQLISRLAHGETDSIVEGIKIIPFLFNPISEECTRETSLRFNMLKCIALPVSLYSTWDKGLPIPSSACSNAATKEESQSVSIPVQAVCAEEDTEEKTDSSADVSNDEIVQSPEAYKDNLIAEARLRKGLFLYNLFDDVTSLLQDVGEYEEITEAHSHNRNYANRPFDVDGWSLDETNNVLTLFFLDQDTGDSNFMRADFAKLGKRLVNFADFSLKGLLSDTVLDLSTEEGSLSYRIEQLHKSEETDFQRIECVILTLRKKISKFEPISVESDGVQLRVHALDYQDLYQLSTTMKNAQLVIDFLSLEFGGEPVQMLAAVDRPDIGYKAFVGMIKAEVLASVYEEYGQKVLSSNVRAFLLTGGRVNKGIQKTIKEEPNNFFAFNNGVCVVASAIRTDLNPKVITLMTAATDFQIVNGGQTTASLHYARKRGISIKNIYVPLKLSVVSKEIDSVERQVFVQNISRYANSQNKVSDSDLGTNTRFQIQFQRCADNSVVVSNGSICRWYYERARGSYRVERIRTNTTKSSKNADFLRKYPQKFDKIELSKWFKAWSDEPHISNVGGQKCFLDFSKDLSIKEKKEGLGFCSTDFFKYAIGKGILYRHIDQLVFNSNWYQAERSYKVNIVGYTMALLRLVIGEMYPGEELNFLRIWKEQQVPSKDDKIKYFDPLPLSFGKALDPVLCVLAKYCRSIFDDSRRTVSDVGEWVKKPACWTLMKQDMPRFEEYREELRGFCCPIESEFIIKSWRDK